MADDHKTTEDGWPEWPKEWGPAPSYTVEGVTFENVTLKWNKDGSVVCRPNAQQKATLCPKICQVFTGWYR